MGHSISEEMSAMSVPLESIPPTVLTVCRRLRDGLSRILGGDLVALWAYGAGVSPNPPSRLGDIDTHGILPGRCNRETAARIDALHSSLEAEYDIEIDGWYVLLADAQKSDPPHHAFRPGLVDESWALHRAHLLAGRCAVIHGANPQAILPVPTWLELEQALQHELRFVEEHLDSLDSAGVAPYAVLNCCRIAYSIESHNVVTSKHEAAVWALERLPGHWHQLIRAATRWYDRGEEPEDQALLQVHTLEFVETVKQRIARSET
jgi:hypothetical protein